MTKKQVKRISLPFKWNMHITTLLLYVHTWIHKSQRLCPEAVTVFVYVSSCSFSLSSSLGVIFRVRNDRCNCFMEVSLYMQVSIESFCLCTKKVSHVVQQEETSFALLSLPINSHPNKSWKGETQKINWFLSICFSKMSTCPGIYFDIGKKAKGFINSLLLLCIFLFNLSQKWIIIRGS